MKTVNTEFLGFCHSVCEGPGSCVPHRSLFHRHVNQRELRTHVEHQVLRPQIKNKSFPQNAARFSVRSLLAEQLKLSIPLLCYLLFISCWEQMCQTDRLLCQRQSASVKLGKLNPGLLRKTRFRVCALLTAAHPPGIPTLAPCWFQAQPIRNLSSNLCFSWHSQLATSKWCLSSPSRNCWP